MKTLVKCEVIVENCGTCKQFKSITEASGMQRHICVKDNQVKDVFVRGKCRDGWIHKNQHENL